MCDEIIEEETKTVPTNFNEKKVVCKTKNFYILLAFLLISIALLISVSIYCYVIKYRAKQKHLLPFHVTDGKLKKFCTYNMFSKMDSNDELKEIEVVRVIISRV